MHHPLDATGLPNNSANLLNGSTICIGDLNAKHTIWGCSSDNTKGCDLLNLPYLSKLILSNLWPTVIKEDGILSERIGNYLILLLSKMSLSNFCDERQCVYSPTDPSKV
ncbi:hypothetical protein CEXT_805241 [Caerostris extrusa]|uniref:Endonuclease/exonuclease/phosphatase domain-containing protein n=1 Tax=Caerostris extrusa TaxID=172846 RepID=A0AAV4XX11_CAEEX|nr:hypothetical protein CEXT_805241 [Caerostris extrusa]